MKMGCHHFDVLAAGHHRTPRVTASCNLTAPLYAAFPAVASVLTGGATLKRATVGNAIIGAVLFHVAHDSAPSYPDRSARGDISELPG